MASYRIPGPQSGKGEPLSVSGTAAAWPPGTIGFIPPLKPIARARRSALLQRLLTQLSTKSPETYATVRSRAPALIDAWGTLEAEFCDAHYQRWPAAQLSEICLEPAAAYIFDHEQDRVCIAFGFAVPAPAKRDESRMKGFPNASATVKGALKDKAFAADKGHFMGHATGGGLDINLFPHRRDLNRPWSRQGQTFREMESYLWDNPGTFFFHRAVYDDDTWVPARLQFGILRDDGWWIHMFDNY